MSLLSEVLGAENRIRKYVRETPLEYSIPLSKLGGVRVYLKLENLQVSGSFKIRGVLNKLLSHDNVRDLFVTASSGNHGIAFAHAIKMLGLNGVVFLPENASPAKIQDIMQYEIDVRFFGRDTVETEAHARRFANANNAVYISPYNDIKVIAGQGTIGLELHKQLRNLDTVVVRVGGGGSSQVLPRT